MAGSGDALGSAWSPVTPRHFCVAGVALGDIHLCFTWQAWRLATSTFVSRGRRGPWRHPPSFSVAGLALIGTHNFVTHTHLCHTPSFTHNFVTHYLSHNFHTHTHLFVTRNFDTQLCHTHLSVTLNFVQLCHT